MGNFSNGISKSDNPKAGDGNTDESHQVDGLGSRPRTVDHEPGERSRLLPSNPHGASGQPPLDIDDPAVTPLNLMSIRFLKYSTLALLIIACAWWLVLFVATFVSPPGIHAPGGGWFAFANTSLSIGILILLLTSFTVPSRAEEVVQSIIAVLLMVNLIIILSVAGIRHEEGLPGIFSSVWLLVVTVWAVVVDRTVEWGKKEEEERLTGRAETRRSLREWCSIFSALTVMVVFLVISVLFTATLSLRAYDKSFKTPGKRIFVDSGNYQVHLYCTSKHINETRETVSVLLEGGERAVANGMWDWAHENYVNGTIGRLCYWDRPGYGFSDVAPSPLSAGMAADALSEALANAGEDGPWVLVSHGIGSIYSRIFASRHGNSIKGLMFIDPLHEDYLPEIGSPRRGFFLWIRGVVSPLGLEVLFNAIFKGRSRQDRIYGGSSYLNPRLIKAKLQESLAAKSFTKTEIATSRAILSRDIPLIVVSSGENVKRSMDWDHKQKELTKVTDNLLYWDIVNKAPHKVWETVNGWEILSKRIGKLVDVAIKGKE